MHVHVYIIVILCGYKICEKSCWWLAELRKPPHVDIIIQQLQLCSYAVMDERQLIRDSE